MENADIEKYFDALQRLFNSEDGKRVAKMWREAYVDTPAFDAQSPEKTLYNLGKKELIQTILEDATNNPFKKEET